MSGKEDAKSQEKKAKKKKSGKSDGKSKEGVEEPAAKDEATKEEPVTEKLEMDQEEVPRAAPEIEEVEAPKKASIKEVAPAEPTVPNKPGKKEKDESKVTSMDLEKLMQLKEAFSLFDFNHDGIIDLQDLKYTFASLGNPNFPEEEMQKMLNEAADPVDFDSFVALFGYKASILEPEEVFTGALATWDMREVGMIPEERLKRDIRCFGDKFSGKETDCALEEAPVFLTEGVNMIDYVRFGNNICGFRNLERTRKHQKKLEEEEARRYE